MVRSTGTLALLSDTWARCCGGFLHARVSPEATMGVPGKRASMWCLGGEAPCAEGGSESEAVEGNSRAAWAFPCKALFP